MVDITITLYMSTLLSQSLLGGQVIFTSISSNERTVCCSEPIVYSYLIFNEPMAHVGRMTGPRELMAV